jgi:electron transfer flavoprotein alpha subunit
MTHCLVVNFPTQRQVLTDNTPTIQYNNTMFAASRLSATFTARRLNSTLVVIEHKGTKLASSNLHAITAAHALKNPITCLVTGGPEVAKLASALPGVTKVLSCVDPSLNNQLAEFHAPLITKCAKDLKFSHVVCAHSAYAKNVFPRVGALLDVSPIPDVTEITTPETFKRPIFAGNAIASVKSTDAIKLISVRTTAFAASETTGGSASIEEFAKSDAASTTKWISEEVSKSDRPELGSAKIVISGGRGMKNGENFEMLYKLADKLGGAGTLT